ncbi:MAG: prenyltransferase [Paludibacteraceae bacterium]|jgi:1,4-dihydroxy-2-naphthoate octaprenyltransferase|nr:prenyltransferase [Paludibacteraceae bacterium]
MRTFKDWVIAARPWSLSASFIAAVAPIAYSFWRFEEIQYWGIAILCVFMMLVFQTAGNLLGDYADHINGVDSRNDYNGVMSMKSGKFTPGEIRAFGFAMLSLGIVIGMFIVLYTRIWWLAAFGAFGVICTAFYYWLKYHALGDVDILFLYSMVPALGIVLLLTGEWHWEMLYICLPYGLQTVAILHANNTRDILSDRAAGIHTMNGYLGGKVAKWLYVAEIIIPFLLIAVFAVIGQLPYWTFITWLTLPVAVKLSTIMLKAPENSDVAIADLDQRQGKLQLMFGLLFCVGLIV